MMLMISIDGFHPVRLGSGENLNGFVEYVGQ